MSNVSLIEDTYDAFGRGDVPGVLASLDGRIHWHEAEGNTSMPSGAAWVGPDAIVNELFLKLATEWDGFEVHPGADHDASDVVVVEARYSGTFEATGRSLDAQVCHVWTIRSGKVTKVQQYVDTAQLQDVMGARVEA